MKPSSTGGSLPSRVHKGKVIQPERTLIDFEYRFWQDGLQDWKLNAQLAYTAHLDTLAAASDLHASEVMTEGSEWNAMGKAVMSEDWPIPDALKKRFELMKILGKELEIQIHTLDAIDWDAVAAHIIDFLITKDYQLTDQKEVAVKTETLLAYLAAYGGKIVSTASLQPEWIAQARASNRLYVDNNSLGYVWEPDIKEFPTNETELGWLQRWYPLSAEMPEHLKNPDFLSRVAIPRATPQEEEDRYDLSKQEWVNFKPKTDDEMWLQAMCNDMWAKWQSDRRYLLSKLKAQPTPQPGESPQELFEEAERLMVKLLPPDTYGENEDADVLYQILEQLRDLATRKKPKL